MKKLLFISFVLFFSTIFISCEDDSETNSTTNTTTKVNQFVWNVMDQVYLWQSAMPRNIDLKKETDPKKYFQKLIHNDDEWSFITDDVEGLLDSFEGKEKSFGYSLIFGKFSNTNNYFAIVEYVNPNSPASQAALKRGDLIIEVNNSAITEDNYSQLFNGPIISITKGIITENGIAEGERLSMSSRELTINPILLSKIIETDGKKIGYLVYNQYINEYNAQLTSVFQNFKDQQVDDVVIDLRFNSGGYVDAAIHLSSILAPSSAVSTPSILIK